MPSSVSTVFAAAGLEVEGAVRWGERVGPMESGVYAVALTADPDSSRCDPVGGADLEGLSRSSSPSAPLVTLDGRRPEPNELVARIAAFWLRDETIVCIGLATSLLSRVRGFYGTPMGARRPHSGGSFLKTLANLGDLYVLCRVVESLQVFFCRPDLESAVFE